MLDDAVLMKDLTDHERLMFQTEMNARRKTPTTGVLLALFLGGVGAHHFYLGRTGLGILYAVFVWTLIPGIVALIECFLMTGRIRAYNAAVGQEIVIKLKGLRPGAESVAPALPASSGSGGRTLPAAATGAVVASTTDAAKEAVAADLSKSEEGGGLAGAPGDDE